MGEDAAQFPVPDIRAMQEKLQPLSAHALPDPEWRACARVPARGDGGASHPVYLDGSIDDIAQRQVYRYCSIAEALDLLEHRRWSFVHPGRWPDPYERHLTERLFGAGRPFQAIRLYAKCVSLEYGSNALWSMYAGRGGVVRLGIRLQNLVAMLGAATVPSDGDAGAPLSAKFYVARCRYMEPVQLARAVDAVAAAAKASSAQAMRAMTMKRDGFRYENEVRVAMLLRAGGAAESAVARQAVFRRAPVDSILVDPYLPPHEAAPLVAMFARLAPRARVQQSGFNEAPPTIG